MVSEQSTVNENQIPSLETEFSVELNQSCTMSLPLARLNNNKYNENLISFTGVLVISAIFIFSIIIPTSGAIHYGLIGVDNTLTNLYVVMCSLPVILPALYFVFHPKHLVRILQDMQCL